MSDDVYVDHDDHGFMAWYDDYDCLHANDDPLVMPKDFHFFMFKSKLKIF